MLLTVSTTATPLGPATDLGHLLHKHPDRVQEFPLSFGNATVLYPEATADRCTALLALEIDPVRLARTRGRSTPDLGLAHHVNDSPPPVTAGSTSPPRPPGPRPPPGGPSPLQPGARAWWSSPRASWRWVSGFSRGWRSGVGSVHQPVFAVLALESEPVDPQL